MQLIGETLPLCNRCLIVLNVTTAIRARGMAADGLHHVEPCPFATNPIALASWAREMLYERDWIIEVNDRTHMFWPISTWHGDPVCSTHLFLLVEAEIRRGPGR